MRKIALATTALAFSGAAYAADLPSKAPPMTPAMAPVEPMAPSWTGFYIGGHVGAAWLSSPTMTLSDPNVPVPAALAPLSLSGSSGAGFLGGIQGGYNWQFDSRWVVGAEGDVSWTNVKSSETVGPLLTNGGLTFLSSSLTMSENVNWLASARARLGFLAWPNTLLYATGGVAWENVNYSASVSIPAAPAATSFSKTSTGFVVGGGVEWQAMPHVLLRAECLFYGFDQNQAGSALIPGEVLPVKLGWSDSNVQVVRAGASYKF